MAKTVKRRKRCRRCGKEYKGAAPFHCSRACQYGSWQERFWKRVDKTLGYGPQGDCWRWIGHIDMCGYGQMCRSYIIEGAHRLSFEIANNRHPTKGLQVMHSCDTRDCVNPSHLSEGTATENTLHTVALGRHSFGERNGQSKLTAEQAREIKRLIVEGCSRKVIAETYSVSLTTIYHIAKGNRWKQAMVKAP
jgi:hypothetical protein